ncbi:MAG: hypothetical protein H0X46_09175 [Bacteroidetes bacterium]|nr:hypothetical protein [Bacteroidota bacterium]
METNKNSTENSTKKLTIIVASLLLLSLIGNGIFFSTHNGLKRERDATELKMDSLLSVKLLVDKELNQAKTEREAYKGRNSELDKTLADMDSKLNDSKMQVDKLVKDNASVNSLRKKLKESEKLREDCSKLVSDYIKDVERLEAQNNLLNKSVNLLSQELETLKGKLELAKNIKVYDMIVINYKVTKKSNKPTIRARKVNRVSATFNLAENSVAESGFKEIFMVVYDAKGGILGSQNKKFTNKSTKKEQVFSASKPLEYKNEEVKMTINFDTEQKLVKGTYKVEIYVDGASSGKKDFVLR